MVLRVGQAAVVAYVGSNATPSNMRCLQVQASGGKRGRARATTGIYSLPESSAPGGVAACQCSIGINTGKVTCRVVAFLLYMRNSRRMRSSGNVPLILETSYCLD